MHSLEASLALADVLVENISSPSWSGDLTQPIVLTGVRIAGSYQKGDAKIEPKCKLTKVFLFTKCPLCCTCLCQVAGISAEAISTNTDEQIFSHPCHACSPIMANIHLTVVTWVNKQVQKSLQEQKQNNNTGSVHTAKQILPVQFTGPGVLNPWIPHCYDTSVALSSQLNRKSSHSH